MLTQLHLGLYNKERGASVFNVQPSSTNSYRSTSPNTTGSSAIIPINTHTNRLTQIHRSDNRHRICQQMASRNLVESSQVRETGCADLTAVWSFASVTHNIHSHLPFWRLDGRIRLSRWHSITLREEQEVVDQSLHVLLHRCTRWRGDLVVFNTNWSWGHLV
jgi:hypothetical protein